MNRVSPSSRSFLKPLADNWKRVEPALRRRRPCLAAARHVFVLDVVRRAPSMSTPEVVPEVHVRVGGCRREHASLALVDVHMFRNVPTSSRTALRLYPLPPASLLLLSEAWRVPCSKMNDTYQILLLLIISRRTRETINYYRRTARRFPFYSDVRRLGVLDARRFGVLGAARSSAAAKPASAASTRCDAS